MTTAGGRVVVQAAMSLDGFIAGPDHSMDWVFDYATPDELPDIVAAGSYPPPGHHGPPVVTVRK